MLVPRPAVLTSQLSYFFFAVAFFVVAFFAVVTFFVVVLFAIAFFGATCLAVDCLDGVFVDDAFFVETVLLDAVFAVDFSEVDFCLAPDVFFFDAEVFGSDKGFLMPCLNSSAKCIRVSSGAGLVFFFVAILCLCFEPV